MCLTCLYHIIADSPLLYTGTTIDTCRGRNTGTLILRVYIYNPLYIKFYWVYLVHSTVVSIIVAQPVIVSHRLTSILVLLVPNDTVNVLPIMVLHCMFKLKLHYTDPIRTKYIGTNFFFIFLLYY